MLGFCRSLRSASPRAASLAILAAVAGSPAMGQEFERSEIEVDPFQRLEQELEQGAELPGARIVNGIEAVSGAYPFMAQLVVTSKDGRRAQFCGGTIIAPRWVLTAAHCLVDRKRGGLRVKSHLQARVFNTMYGSLRSAQGERRRVKRMIPHPGYSSRKALENDIALLELDRPVVAPSAGLPEGVPGAAANTAATIAGWGRIGSNRRPSSRLLHADTKVVSRQRCDNKYGKARLKGGATAPGVFGKIDHRRICAASERGEVPVDTCQGDSGGPLLQKYGGNWFVMGVVSYGIGCADPRYPGVYTNVAAFMPWIKSTMGTDFDSASAGTAPGGSGTGSGSYKPKPPPVIVGPPEPAPTELGQLFNLVDQGGVSIKQVPRGPLQPGQTVTFEVASNIAGKLYVLEVSSSNTLRQLFPNHRTEKFGRSATIGARQMRMVPDRRDGFRLKVPVDTDTKWVVAIVAKNDREPGRVGQMTRGLSPIPSPGEYLRRLLKSIDCGEGRKTDCAGGFAALNVQ